MKAINLSDETAILFKNQKVGIITDIVDCSDPLNLSREEDGPTVSHITNDTPVGHVKELGIDLSDSDLSAIQRGQLEDLLLS